MLHGRCFDIVAGLVGTVRPNDGPGRLDLPKKKREAPGTMITRGLRKRRGFGNLVPAMRLLAGVIMTVAGMYPSKCEA